MLNSNDAGKKNIVATANCASIDLLCAFIWSNFSVLGSIPKEIKQSPSGTLISYASVAAGEGERIKYANSKQLTGAMKHSADGQYLFDNRRFRELSETFKFSPWTCN